MSDTIGELLSQYVQERTVAPEPDGIDLWVEAVCAGLFAVGVSIVPVSVEARKSKEAMDRHWSEFCTNTAIHANAWMNESLRSAGILKGSVTIDFRDDIKSHLQGYFGLFLAALDEADISVRDLRWVALRSGLAIAAKSLCSRGLISQRDESRCVDDLVNQSKRLISDLPSYAH